MKLLHQYEYNVRIIADNENYFGKLSVNVRSSYIYYTITYDGCSAPFTANTISLPKDFQTNRFSVFKIIASSNRNKYKLINL